MIRFTMRSRSVDALSVVLLNVYTVINLYLIRRAIHVFFSHIFAAVWAVLLNSYGPA